MITPSLHVPMRRGSPGLPARSLGETRFGCMSAMIELPELLDLTPGSAIVGITARRWPREAAMTGLPELLAMMTAMIDRVRRDEARRDRDGHELLMVDWDHEFIPDRYEVTWPKKPQKAKKARVSRKGKKYGPHVPIIIDKWFGTMQVTGCAPNDRKHRRVYFFCSLCGGTGKCRFSELRDGTVKSCNCLERAADRQFQDGIDDWVKHLETRERKAIFRDIITLSTAKTMELRGLSKRHCDTLWRHERDRLARIPQGTLSAICRMAKSNSISAVAKTYKLAHAEVLHIVRTADRAQKATAKAEQAVWDALDEASRTEAERTLCAAIAQIDEALENAAIEEWSEGSEGRWFGELTQAEFCLGERYCYFGWIYASACLMPDAVAKAMFGDRLARFKSLVRHTVGCRAGRQKAFFKSQAGREPVRKASKPRMARRKDGYYDPRQDAAITAQRMTLMSSINRSPTNKVSAHDGYSDAKRENLKQLDSFLTSFGIGCDAPA